MWVKLLYANMFYNDDFGSMVASSLEDSEWEEISDKDYDNLCIAINNQNIKYGQSEKVILVRKPEPDKPLHSKLVASKYLEKVREEQKAREESNRKFKEKRELAKQKREIARLKKLKEKYGDVT